MRVAEDRAKEISIPFAARFAKAIRDSEEQLHDDRHISSLTRLQWDHSTWAHAMQRAVVHHVRQSINPYTDPGVLWDSSTGVDFLYVEDVAVFRFKLLDVDLLTRNNPTAQSLLLDDPDLPMPGMPPTIARLTLGWQFDRLAHHVQGTYIVQPNRQKRPFLVLALEELVAAATVLSITRPQDPVQDAPRPAPRVEAKPGIVTASESDHGRVEADGGQP